MQLDLHLVIARILDWPFQHDFMPVNLDSDFVLEPVNNVLRGDRTKSFSSLAGLQCEDESRFSIRRPILLPRSIRALRARRASFESIELAQRGWCDFVCFAAWQEIISRITATHFDHVRFCAETGNVFGQNKFGQRHIDFLKRAQNFST